MSAVINAADKTYDYVDDRLASSNFVKRSVGKVFPDHWSFMLGEVALYSFIILLLSGTYLTLFFRPSMVEVIYNGSYIPLKGVEMSEAYESSLNISFDIRGGLLMRQIHHWAALFFVSAVMVHLLRVFFTGAFRKPREMNWVIGTGLLVLAILAGFAGYSLPDDLLSGTGLRIADGVILSIPLVGTYLSFFIFGGQFPGTEFISRLYAIHILVVPGLILALVTVHLMMVWYQKHTQFPGQGRTNNNVVGYPLMPVYMAKAGGFFFIVFGVTILISGLVTINPIWMYGPYTPDQVTAGSQPDWYIGFLEGSLRMMPNWETVVLGHTISWNVLIPSVVLPGLMFTVLGLYPFIERWATKDDRPHHLLERPRNNPTRTGLGVMAISFYVLLWIAGGNDVIARFFDLSVNSVTSFLRICLFVVPPIAFVVTKRTCLSLQRRDRDKLLHGIETGNIMRLPHGEFIEIHAPLSAEEEAEILGKETHQQYELPPATDENGVALPQSRKKRLQAKLSHFYYADSVPLPSKAEIEAAQAHVAEEAVASEPILEDQRELRVAHEGAVLTRPRNSDDASVH